MDHPFHPVNPGFVLFSIRLFAYIVVLLLLLLLLDSCQISDWLSLGTKWPIITSNLNCSSERLNNLYFELLHILLIVHVYSAYSQNKYEHFLQLHAPHILQFSVQISLFFFSFHSLLSSGQQEQANIFVLFYFHMFSLEYQTPK